MTIQGATAPTTAQGRERNCAQCNTVYRAPRASARYCTPRCRKRASRGTDETHRNTLDLLRRWLLRRTYAGHIGPVNRRDPRAAIYALAVPRVLALAEWNGWNPGAAMSEQGFTSALEALRFHGPEYVPPHKRP